MAHADQAYDTAKVLTLPSPGAIYPKPWHGLFERLIREWDHRQSPDADCMETALPSAVYMIRRSIRPS